MGSRMRHLWRGLVALGLVFGLNAAASAQTGVHAVGGGMGPLSSSAEYAFSQYQCFNCQAVAEGWIDGVTASSCDFGTMTASNSCQGIGNPAVFDISYA